MLDQPRLLDRRRLQMNSIPSQVESGLPSAASPPSVPRQSPKHEQLDVALQALAIPFDLVVIQWRVTEYSDDGTRGLMLPYADPRAYSDRLNDVFTPAGWTRRYAVQASAPVQRGSRAPAETQAEPSRARPGEWARQQYRSYGCRDKWPSPKSDCCDRSHREQDWQTPLSRRTEEYCPGLESPTDPRDRCAGEGVGADAGRGARHGALRGSTGKTRAGDRPESHLFVECATSEA